MICDTAGPNESEAPLVTVSYSNSWPREVELFEFEPKCVYRFASGHYGPKEHGEKLKSETSVRIGKLAPVAETTGRDSTGGSSPPITVLTKRNTRLLNQWSTCKTTGLNEMGALLIVACLGAVFQNCFSNAKRSLARIVSIWTTSCHKVAKMTTTTPHTVKAPAHNRMCWQVRRTLQNQPQSRVERATCWRSAPDRRIAMKVRSASRVGCVPRATRWKQSNGGGIKRRSTRVKDANKYHPDQM